MAISNFIGLRSFSLDYLITFSWFCVLFPLPTITTPSKLPGLSILSRSPPSRFADATVVVVAASKQPENETSKESESAQFDILTPENQQKIADVPEGMQWKRFMWNEIDETMDQLMQGVADGTRVVKKMIDGALSSQPIRYKPSASNKVKFIIKSQPIRKFIKPKTGPKKDNKDVRSKKNSKNLHDALREMEKKEEQKVEAAMKAKFPKMFDEEIITGKISGYGDWKPVTKFSPPPTTEKPHPVSELHTSVIDLPVDNSYEVTEHLTEETIQRPISLQLKTFESLRPDSKPNTTTEKPNYPEYFLNQHKNLDVVLTESPSILREQKVLERPIVNRPQHTQGATTAKLPDISSSTYFSNHRHSSSTTAPYNVQRDHIVNEKSKPNSKPKPKPQSRPKGITEATLYYSERRKKQGSLSSLKEQSYTHLPYSSSTDHTTTLLGRGTIKFGDKL